MTKRTTDMTETSVGAGFGGRRFELRDDVIYVLPLEREKAPGVTSITVGFPLAVMSEYVGADTAAGVVAYLNQPQPRAVSAAEGDLLWRCLEALDKIHGWLVCHSIASADDMAQMFPEMTAVAEDILSQAREVTR